MGVFIKEGRKNYSRNSLFCLFIILSQIFGGILGVVITYLGQQSTDGDLLYPGVAKLCPRNNDDGDPEKACAHLDFTGGIFLCEFIVTFIFVSVILSIKYHNGANDLLINAFCIGLTLFTMITIAGGISGGCVNPAVGLV